MLLGPSYTGDISPFQPNVHHSPPIPVSGSLNISKFWIPFFKLLLLARCIGPAWRGPRPLLQLHLLLCPHWPLRVSQNSQMPSTSRPLLLSFCYFVFCLAVNTTDLNSSFRFPPSGLIPRQLQFVTEFGIIWSLSIFSTRLTVPCWCLFWIMIIYPETMWVFNRYYLVNEPMNQWMNGLFN